MLAILAIGHGARAQGVPAVASAVAPPATGSASAAVATAAAPAPAPARDAASQLWGYRQVDGNWAIAPVFRTASAFDQGLAFIENPDGSGGLINRAGAMVTPNVQQAVWISEPTMTEARMSEGLLAARDFASDKVGFVDQQGRWVIRPRFVDAHEFHEGLAAFRLSPRGKVGFIDRKGREVIPPRFGTNFRVPPVFSEGLAAVGLNDQWPRSNLDAPGKLGYIDTRGRWVMPPVYESGSDFWQGQAKVMVKGREQMVDHPAKR